jgi:hypothetical protein
VTGQEEATLMAEESLWLIVHIVFELSDSGRNGVAAEHPGDRERTSPLVAWEAEWLRHA